jgi:hypothetical protein
MYPAPDHVVSHRVERLAPKLADKSYRDGYVSTQLRIWLADQVRALRGDMTQAEFGKLIGKPQTVVSRLEDPDYGRLTIETLLEVASKLDIALLVRFVDYSTFLLATNDLSDNALRPMPYSQAAIDALALQLPAQSQLRVGTIATGMTINLQTSGTVNYAMVNQPSGLASQFVIHSESNFLSHQWGLADPFSIDVAASSK